ncbi:copper resistance CopC family protein [Salibacterium salarium]|uniref:copper resistance CopC family protein n=1 Tax=Salibacterium salarium TaxID=284579 RepID=UPI00163B08FF|nr:copper resistance protein CopC [Salibacterium salarium]
MKRFITLFIIGLLLFPVAAGAHTHLENADLKEEVADGETTIITLTFDSKVQELNSVNLTNENGEEVDVDGISQGPENTVTITLPDFLENGEYSLFYSIVGEDGHVMEKELAYMYEGTEQRESSVEEADEQTEESAVKEEEDRTSASGEDTIDASTAESNDNDFFLTAAGGLLVIAVGVIFFYRKKRA